MTLLLFRRTFGPGGSRFFFGNLLAVALAPGLLCVGSCHFAVWCEENDLRELADIEPMHVAAYIELQNFSAGPRG